jgi:two-component system chemotaxis response regulator CheY
MKNILVLDDNKDILEIVSTRLDKYVKGCSVVTATDGAQGEAILRSTAVDLILTDLSMPVMNGYTLIERAKKDYPSVPVCVMTADCSTKVVSRLQSMGVGRWIQKPFKFEQLARMIAEELKLRYDN